jgi:hypothetical protein
MRLAGILDCQIMQAELRLQRDSAAIAQVANFGSL